MTTIAGVVRRHAQERPGKLALVCGDSRGDVG